MTTKISNLKLEHCTGITEVMGLNPIQTQFFWGALISQLLKLYV